MIRAPLFFRAPAEWTPPLACLLVLCFLTAPFALADDAVVSDSAPTVPETFMLPLPSHLSPEQRETAKAILTEAEPRLTALRQEMNAILSELHNLSFAVDTPPDELGILGRRLVSIRNAIVEEVQRVCHRLEQEAGFNPRLEFRRACMFRHSRHCGHGAPCVPAQNDTSFASRHGASSPAE